MEAAALRQQLAVYKRRQPRPKLNRFDRLFWVVVRRIWANWSEALILVKPDTVVSWHRAGYRLFWTWRSRRQRVGWPKVAEEVRDLIRRMKRENPMWGAPRIYGELLLLGSRSPNLPCHAICTPEAHSGGKKSPPVARFSKQPSRGDGRLRLLHCADPLFPNLILLLRD